MSTTSSKPRRTCLPAEVESYLDQADAARTPIPQRLAELRARFPHRDAGTDWAVWCYATAEVA